MTNEIKTSQTAIGQGLIVGGLLLLVSLVVKLLSPDSLSPATGQRLIGAMMGAVLVFYANALPKTLPSLRTSLTTARCSPQSEQALRRFVGWMLTLAGLGYALAWIVVPFESAKAISASILGASMVIVILRLVRLRLPRTSTTAGID